MIFERIINWLCGGELDALNARIAELEAYIIEHEAE